MAYTWRTLTVADTPAWSDLVAVLAAHDGTADLYSAQDLAEELEFPGVDPALDTVAVVTDDGALVGFGQVFFRAELIDGLAAADTSGGVHPDHRGRGIGTEVLHRLASAARFGNARRHPGIASALRVDCGVGAAQARTLFGDEGFAEARFFHEMTQDLGHVDDGWTPSPSVRPYSPATDREAVRTAHNAAFADHWRFAPRAAGEWTTVVDGRAFRPDLSFVQPGPGGAIDGYILCAEYVAGELYVMIVGVRPQLRGHGVGAALLRTALRAGVAAGCDKATLDVDTDNSTGALRLYETVGFRVGYSSVASLKTLPPAPLANDPARWVTS